MADSGKKGINVEVTLKNVRLSFEHLFNPQVSENDDGDTVKKYSAQLLLDPKKNKADIEAMDDAIAEVSESMWPGKKLLPDDRLCMRDGEDKSEDYPEYEGMLYVSASNTKRPAVVDRDRSPLTAEDGKPYSGCFVNAVVRVWGMDKKKWGKRVCASLEAVQFAKDADAFSGSKPVNVDEKFDVIEDDEDDRRSRRSSRGRDDEDRGSRRGRDRDEDQDRGARRSRSRDDDDEDGPGARRSRGGRDRDEGRGSRRRSRDDDEGEGESLI